MELITSILTPLIERHNLLAVFVLMTMGTALIPIPSEVVMPYAGFLVNRGFADFWPIVAVGTLGNLLGSLLTYYLGYKLGDKSIVKFIRKWGRFLLIRQSEYDKVKRWFVRHGLAAAFYSRLLPVVRAYISLPVGIAKDNVKVFALVTTAGSFIWATVLTYLGLMLGASWQAIEPFFRQFQVLLLGALVIFVFFFFWRKFKPNR